MLHKIIIGTSKFFFTLFVIGIVGFIVMYISMSVLHNYINSEGLDTFIEQVNTLLNTI